MVHGLIDSSDVWVIHERNKTHAFIMADQGYDVWLANTRGNKYSRAHKWLDPENDIEYWDKSFSLEIARNDIPAFIEHVKKHSEVDNMTLVAHSQSTQMMFYNLATNSSYYAKHINFLVAMGPVMEPSDTSDFNKKTMYFLDWLEPVIKPLKLFCTFGEGFFMRAIMFPCMYWRWWGDIGGTRVAWTTSEFHDWERTKVFYGHYPSGSSIRCWQHMAQQFRAGSVIEYDYGHAKNMQVYGQSFPPTLVDFSKVNQAGVPIAMYVAKHDLIIFPKDSRRAHE